MITEEEVIDNFKGIGIIRNILVIKSVRIANFSKIIKGLKKKLFSPKITLLVKYKFFSDAVDGINQIIRYKEDDIEDIFNTESVIIKRLKENNFDFIIIPYNKKEGLEFNIELLTMVLNAPYVCEWNDENQVRFYQRSHYFHTII